MTLIERYELSRTETCNGTSATAAFLSEVLREAVLTERLVVT